ncbi:MAG: metallophosphoesterase [Zetaproteobacteria bacterium]|nr:metallophosphoesterase [Zetaproteobacteria bacterium]
MIGLQRITYTLILCFCPFNAVSFSQNTAAAKESYPIAAFGDFGEQDPSVQLQVRDALLAIHDQTPFWRGFLLGDNFYPNGLTNVIDRQFVDKMVYPYSGLGIPFHAALGNHDHRGNIYAQIQLSHHPSNPVLENGERLWQMPDRIYQRQWTPHTGGPDLSIFVLDTEMADPENPGNTASPPWEQQLSWLDQRLRECSSRWKIVIGHHPVRSDFQRTSCSPQWRKMRFDQLVKILRTHQVHLYLSGHDHSLQVLPLYTAATTEGFQGLQIISGAAGSLHIIKRYTHQNALYRSAPGQAGFMSLRIYKDTLQITPVVITPHGTKGYQLGDPIVMSATGQVIHPVSPHRPQTTSPQDQGQAPRKPRLSV